MGLLKVGELPKVNSGGHRPKGMFLGHEEDAEELRRLAKHNEQKQWGCVRMGVKAPTASRTAAVIRKGLAPDFLPDEEGYFIAKARQGDGYAKGSNETFEVWVKYKLYDSEQERAEVAEMVANARSSPPVKEPKAPREPRARKPPEKIAKSLGGPLPKTKSAPRTGTRQGTPRGRAVGFLAAVKG